MLRSYFVIAFRNLLRNRIFSAINIFGLAIGLATCLLITLYIFDEAGYDKHHKDAERVFRIASISNKGDDWAAAAAPVAWGLKSEIPEVEQVTRLLKFPNMDNVLMRYDDGKQKKQFFETNGYYVDSTFFELFTYRSLYGNISNALHNPNTIVISSAISEKLFGKNTDPVGKVIKLSLPFGDSDYTVTAVFKKNSKSHIPANFFLSMRNTDAGTWVATQTNWATNNIFYTYLKLKPGVERGAFEKKLQPFYDHHAGSDMKAGGFSKTLFIQPLTSIYLRSNLGGEIASNGNIRYLYILGSIAVFILIIACINFMNLSTARSEKRAREVGVRKVMGANKGSLVRQFIGESIFMSTLALLLALIVASLFLPLFNSLTGKELRLFADYRFLYFVVGLALCTGFLAGVYPAFYLSSFKPALVIKGKIVNHFSAAMIRKGLVIFQFTISVCLIFGAIVIQRQLNYVASQPLGFNKEQQLVLPLRNSEAVKNYAVLKNELLNDAEVKSVTSCSAYPGIEVINDMLFYSEGKTHNDNVDIHMAAVENDFFKTLGFTIIHGRGFSKEFTADSASIVLNERAVRDLGYSPEKAVGRKVYYDWQNQHFTMHIVGVVKDFHYESLHNEIRPFGFSNSNFFANKYNYVVANIQSGNYAQLLSRVERTWNGINAATPFTYSFIDQDFLKNYNKEMRTSGIVVCFTAIAIVIACLGLFGLAVFSGEQRTKEIGIRKVLGASVRSIITLLSKDFVKLIAAAFCISFPLAWWLMSNWLANFAYRIDIMWWMFAVSGSMALIVAFVTVSYQSLKSAYSNPIKGLRTE